MTDLPRVVSPETVEPGDTVTVTYAKRNGIVQAMTGVVDRRVDNGASRIMLTAEGARLFTWTVGGRSPGYTVTLLKRAALIQTALWSDDQEELSQRIA